MDSTLITPSVNLSRLRPRRCGSTRTTAISATPPTSTSATTAARRWTNVLTQSSRRPRSGRSSTSTSRRSRRASPTCRPASMTSTRSGPGGGRSTTSSWASGLSARHGWTGHRQRDESRYGRRPERRDVTNTGGGATTKTFAGNGDGFYAMFAPAGNQSFEASLKLYGPRDKSGLVVPNGVTVLDFALPSGKLTANPTEYNIRVAPERDAGSDAGPDELGQRGRGVQPA